MSLFLRPLQEEDSLISYKWRNDPEVWEFTGRRPDKLITPEIEANWIKDVIQRGNERRFAICLKGSNEYIGNVQLTNINSYDAEFHIFIGEKKFWGSGHGTVATRAIIDFAFNELKISSIYLSVHRDNTGAIRAYEKVGFYKLLDLKNGFIKMALFALDSKPKIVSIFMITYNHEKYIQQALDSILRQEVNFDYEIVVGEDLSTDNTRDILLSYHKQYPGKFKLLLHSHNLGAINNQIQTFLACKGKYIALCEGDDYWTDHHKLVNQVKFLEKNPEFNICGDNALVVYEDGRPSHAYSNFSDSVFSLEDLPNIKILPTVGLLVRNVLPSEFPDWYLKTPFGDTGLIILLSAEGGLIKWVNKISSVYRIHCGGVSNSFKDFSYFDRARSFYNEVNQFYKYKHNKFFMHRIGELEYYKADFLVNVNQSAKAIRALNNSIKYLLKSGNYIGKNHIELFFKILNKSMRGFIGLH